MLLLVQSLTDFASAQKYLTSTQSFVSSSSKPFPYSLFTSAEEIEKLSSNHDKNVMVRWDPPLPVNKDDDVVDPFYTAPHATGITCANIQVRTQRAQYTWLRIRGLVAKLLAVSVPPVVVEEEGAGAAGAQQPQQGGRGGKGGSQPQKGGAKGKGGASKPAPQPAATPAAEKKEEKKPVPAEVTTLSTTTTTQTHADTPLYLSTYRNYSTSFSMNFHLCCPQCYRVLSQLRSDNTFSSSPSTSLQSLIIFFRSKMLTHSMRIIGE